jgi:lipoprotein-anchoring transpeptidase ErfK/SrfK
VDPLHVHLRFTVIRRSVNPNGLSATFHEIFTRRSAIVGAVVLSLAGCGGTEGRSIAEGTTTAATTTVPSCRPGAFRRLGSDALAYAGVVRSRAVVLRRPGGSRLATFGRLNVNGVPTVFALLGERLDASCRPVLYHVQVPMRPNGSTGWVASRALDVAVVRTRIEVDLSSRRLTLFRRGRALLRAPVAIGSSATPTPTGRYYVNQRLIPADRTGPFGPGAVGISAFSDVLTGWTQGGPIAIHGTDAPWSIGRAVSNGCIRLRNGTLLRVFRAALAGTPVIIRA